MTPQELLALCARIEKLSPLEKNLCAALDEVLHQVKTQREITLSLVKRVTGDGPEEPKG